MADGVQPSVATSEASTSNRGRQNHRGRTRRQPATTFHSGGISQSDTTSPSPLRPIPLIPLNQAGSANHLSAEHHARDSSAPLDSGQARMGDHGSERGPATASTLGRGRGPSRRGGRGQQGINATTQQLSGSHLSNGRQFGGRLTLAASDATTQESQVPTLQGGAVDFVPGQQEHATRVPSLPIASAKNARETNKQPPSLQQRRDSMKRSTAPDIATRTHEDILNGLYDCMICVSEIGRNTKVWSCKTCWAVFHLSCIRNWSQSKDAQAMAQDGQDIERTQWRCPACNLDRDKMPTAYFCWCEKEVDPRPMGGIPPHSCGNTCGKKPVIPAKCPHPCELICHAGPCPPCNKMGPMQMCYCGKQQTTRKCVETDYDDGWGCGTVCGDDMPCGEHKCPQLCHAGLCGACEVPVSSRCYCGSETRELPCFDRAPLKKSKRTIIADGKENSDEWNGVFDCGQPCGRPFDCEKHFCGKPCHPQDADTPCCPRSPDVVTHCTCGKTPLSELQGAERMSCEDPVSSCSKTCEKPLLCGHLCKQVCHSGGCRPCLERIIAKCRCGRVEVSTICHQGFNEQPQCRRICRATMNCGRHECGEHCCSGERKGTERMASKRKYGFLVPNEEVEAEHICFRTCGRQLKCGSHACQELCHRGSCKSCREAIFDEIGCHCGKTILQPPLPCGTQPPACRFACERQPSCGHPAVPHTCHQDNESCPRCPFLLEKPCLCGKKRIKNQPCYLTNVQCGEVCGRLLKCGSHNCQKTCHRPGECEDVGRGCTQQCGKPKKRCGHPCAETCHAPSTCKEDKPCQSKLIITCDCQHLKTETKCLASKSSEGNINKTLKCDDECGRLERNRQLALALNIDPASRMDNHVPYQNDTLRLYQDLGKFAHEKEKDLRVFAADDKEKRLRFPPMSKMKRHYLHVLAEDFGFDSESMDPEPHRHVSMFKTPRFVKAPMKTIQDCIRIRALSSIAPTSASESQTTSSNTSNLPFNGFLLKSPRFALTVDELHNDLVAALTGTPTLSFDISFLPSEQVVLKARPASATTTIQPLALDSILRSLKSSIASAVRNHTLGKSICLCALDSSLNILRRETDSTTEGGWSKVAAKAASGPKTMPEARGIGTKSSFMVLGTKAVAKKNVEEKGKSMEPGYVVDDWEEEMKREEDAEKTAISRNDE